MQIMRMGACYKMWYCANPKMGTFIYAIPNGYLYDGRNWQSQIKHFTNIQIDDKYVWFGS